MWATRPWDSNLLRFGWSNIPPFNSLVASGVSRNTHLSFTTDTAFINMDDCSLIHYIGRKLTIIDSAGKVLIGYIKARGTGETLGGEMSPDLPFNVPGDWTAGSGWSVSGGKATGNGTGSATTLIAAGIGTAAGQLIRHNFDLLTQTGGGVFVRATAYLSTIELSTPANYTSYFCAAGTGFGLQSNLFAGTVDNISIKQVLTPNINGVTIVSAADGSSFNWTSEGSGFKRNDTIYKYFIQ